LQTLMHQRGFTKELISSRLWHLELMGFPFFKALGQVLPNIFLMVGLHILWGFIVWFI
jgi:hypothetical protein